MSLRGAFSRAMLGAIFGLFLWGAPFAQAACYTPGGGLPASAVDAFLANPAALLTQFPNGGAQMISRIRDLAASNPATLNVLISLVGNANPAQQTAIGTGLGQAALVCVKNDQQYAAQIQQAVAQTNNTTVIAALTAVLGDQPIGAAGGGGGGDGGGVGQTTPFATSGGSLGGTTPTPNLFATNPSNNYFTSSFATGASPGTVTTASTSGVTTSVSSH